ncbi:hypothetical protein [Lysinibacillus endophyticus]|uniref:hypothetical protein n=1 Tax=Ureibacillus endophyticus TaxID=1978490 RepID=UPI00209F74A1|nr:hypothetical protein [Lysinibacillus endophyticus]MCP1146158.1 hypothetical protein [Lysinibacillus endophyticus]
MMLIDELLQELADISTEFNHENDAEIRNLKLDLLIQRVESIEVNMSEAPLESLDIKVKKVFNQLLLKHKVKSVSSLQSLKQMNKRSYNRVVRTLISKRLFFSGLNNTMTRSISSYKEKNKLQHIQPFQIFVEREYEKQ